MIMIIKTAIYISCCAILLCHVDCFKILQITSVPSKSHYFLSSALANGLSEAGHDVTLVTSFEAKKSKADKFNLIVLNDFLSTVRFELPDSILNLGRKNAFWKLWFSCYLGNLNTRKIFEHPKFQEILNSPKKYDAIILEQFSNDALKVVAHKLNAPLILFHSVGATSAVNPLVGNPSPSSYVSDIFLSYPSRMNFWQRLENFILSAFITFYKNFYYYPEQNKILKEFYPDAPDLNQLNYNASLILLMGHESTQQAVPLVPNMINIGGFHLKPSSNDLGKLQTVFDNAKDGVIYFGVGTNVKISTIKNDTQQVLLNSLGKLKQTVLMQWDEKIPENVPKNILMSKWFPQQAILAHTKTKLFISHAGMLSFIETIYHGIPILALPVFADQHSNGVFAQESGFGITMSWFDLTEKNLSDALDKLLTNPKYLENAKKQSSLSHDRPLTAMQTAVYWVEFVCRHRGAKHLRVAGTDLPWYQYFLVDVILFLLLIIVFIVSALLIFCRKISSIFKGKLKSKGSKKNDKKQKVKKH